MAEPNFNHLSLLERWGRAFTSIPKITKGEWQNLDIVSRWLIATRAGVLVITFLSCALTGIFAYRENKFDWELWIFVTLGLLLCHTTNNLLNDLVDWNKGVDQGNYFRNQYGTHPLEVMSKEEAVGYLLVSGLSALAIGVNLVLLGGPTVFYLALAGAFFLLFYTFPLKYIGLGEISVFLVWGLLMIGGGYYTITGEWSWDVVVGSCPYALGVTTIIFGKHTDKAELDAAKRIYTLPVILGESLSKYSVVAMMILQYLSTFYLIITGYFSPFLLLVLFALPVLKKVIDVYLFHPKPQGKEGPFPDPKYPKKVWPLYYVAYAFAHNKIFGQFFLGGLLLDTLYTKYYLN